MECKEGLANCLRDAGCPEKTIAACMAECGNAAAQRRILEEYRKKLLQTLHTDEKRLSCLDYVLYCLRSEGEDCGNRGV